jgi:hypothetical protein
MAVEKREQVFISSTYMDLQEERQAIIQTLLQADCLPAGMELFPASDDEKWDLIKRVIDDSDYYILVVGGRYGSTDQDGLSFTEKEYDYAKEVGKPIMAFLHGEPGSIPVEKSELDAAARNKLDAFRAKAGSKMAKFWTTAEGLAGAVALSLIQTRKTHPAEGWVRASGAITPEVEREIADLRAQLATAQKELQQGREVLARRDFDADLAQGADAYAMPIVIRYFDQETVDANRTSRPYAGEHLVTVETSWDQVFAHLAPAMMNEATESMLRNGLNNLAEQLVGDDPDLPDDAVQWLEAAATATAMADVKVQFSALGLMEQSTKRHPVTDKNSWWTLTSEGREHLMRLRAIRRDGSAPLAHLDESIST